MISTVTTSTVTSVTTMIGFGAILSLIVIIAFTVFLIIKELAGTQSGNLSKFLVKSLDVSIVPLFIVFAMIVAMRVVEILNPI